MHMLNQRARDQCSIWRSRGWKSRLISLNLLKEGEPMKRLFAGLAFMAIMAVSSLSMATTWTDTSLDNKLFNATNTSYTHTYDITDGPNGFVPGTDFAFFGNLHLNFTNFNGFDTAIINIGNFLPYTMGIFNPGDPDVLFGLGALWSINEDGKLDLTVTRLYGTFTLVDSFLCVEGCDNSAPVPEPGTVMLLGAGFLGLAVYAKRRKTV